MREQEAFMKYIYSSTVSASWQADVLPVYCHFYFCMIADISVTLFFSVNYTNDRILRGMAKMNWKTLYNQAQIRLESSSVVSPSVAPLNVNFCFLHLTS